MDKKNFFEQMKSGINFSEQEKFDIISESLKRCPKRIKTVVCMEELAELTQELSKQIRNEGNYYGLLEEIADVYICLGMIRRLYDIEPAIMKKAIDVKLAREKERIKTNTIGDNMDELIYKEVDFFEYCPKCKYQTNADSEHPCDDCLAESVNLYSKKPVFFREKK